MREYGKMVKNAFNYSGRARRREYWVPSLINSAIACFFAGLMFLVATLAGDCLWYSMNGSFGYTTTGSAAATMAYIPSALFSIFTFIVGLSLGVRRFHDAGFKAWVYALCYVGICCCGLGGIGILVIGGIFDSKPDNEWGPNPKLANPNEYTGAGSIILGVVLYIIGIIFEIACMVSNMFLDPTLFY